MAFIDFEPVAGSVSFADGDSLDYDTDDVFCTAVKIGGRKLDIVKVPAPGEFGHGTQNFGAGSKFIEIELMYSQSSETNCMVQWENDTESLSAGTFQMTINGVLVYDGCIISGTPKAEQPRSTGLGGYRMTATIMIECARP